ncbi:MAG TPA: hypothetical protein VH024_17455 [Candidatus Angelobacter sp.]|jgi:hypothetical protein|nr:hypothetical protein [Candidatus Angelobacter sp.]
MSKARHLQMQMGHEDNRYGGKPEEHPNKGHPMHHKRARGGAIGDDEKKTKEEVYAGAGSDTLKEAERRKRGGKAPMHVAGHASKHHRLDRRGRKRGGAVGADSSPFTGASKLSAAEGENRSEYNKLDREDD